MSSSGAEQADRFDDIERIGGCAASSRNSDFDPGSGQDGRRLDAADDGPLAARRDPYARAIFAAGLSRATTSSLSGTSPGLERGRDRESSNTQRRRHAGSGTYRVANDIKFASFLRQFYFGIAATNDSIYSGRRVRTAHARLC